MPDYHGFNIADSDFAQSAMKWSKELLLLPVLALKDSTKYMTGMPGVRYLQKVGAYASEAQFAPYKKDRKSAGSTTIDYRDVKTYFGNVVEEFDPNEFISTILGENSGKLGDQLKTAEITRLVIASIMKSLGEKINEHLWDAEYDASGNTTATLFDGFGKIISDEITAGKIAEAKKNYMELDEEITAANAQDIAKEIEFSLDTRLRHEEHFLFCSQDFADKYNESYLLSHSGLIYNDKYEQTVVEGSNRKMTLAPLACMDDANYFFVAPKANVIYAYDNMSDVEKIQVDRFAPFVLTLSAAMFFGVQFRTLDYRMLKVVKLYSE